MSGKMELFFEPENKKGIMGEIGGYQTDQDDI